jgi:hypothetical protein
MISLKKMGGAWSRMRIELLFYAQRTGIMNFSSHGVS